MMQKITEAALLKKIQSGQTFSATLCDGSLEINIHDYVPYIATAIHDGHRLRKSLGTKINLTAAQRLYEEDPCTGNVAKAFPISIIAKDSRYEYDLNRAPNLCIYDEAWGKKVWKTELTSKQRHISLEKHAQYYRIMSALVAKIEAIHEKCIIIDFHSYNYIDKNYQDPPTFNLGTTFINKSKWRSCLNKLNHIFSKGKLENIETTFAINNVFFGKGYQAEFAQTYWKNSLLLPFEIKKIYINEKSGKVYPVVLEQLCKYIYTNFMEIFKEIFKNSTSSKPKSTVYSSNIEELAIEIDKKLYAIAHKFETLQYINPTNILSEKKKFFANKCRSEPNFKYRPLKIDPYKFKESLYRLPVSNLSDPTLKEIFRKVIDAYASKIDLLTTIGTDKFIYNSLRYYGEPNELDSKNASFILHAPKIDSIENEPKLGINEVTQAFAAALKDYDISCEIKSTSKIAAQAMVDPTTLQILIRNDISICETQLQALINHELGVHMVTSMNAKAQPLKVFALGMPMNTHTQEGLAILSEYLSGNMTIDRLRVLGLRVFAVKHLLNDFSFSKTFQYLVDEYNLNHQLAFTIVTRVYRGGGFTKDFLYLSGLKDVYCAYQNRDISNLLVGKTSLLLINELDDLRARGIIEPLKYYPKSFKKPQKAKADMAYLLSALK